MSLFQYREFERMFGKNNIELLIDVIKCMDIYLFITRPCNISVGSIYLGPYVLETYLKYFQRWKLVFWTSQH